MRPLVILGPDDSGREVAGLAADAADRASFGVVRTAGPDRVGTEAAHPEAGDPVPREASFAIGAGDPVIRRRLDASATERGWRAATLVHPAAWVGTGTELGAGSLVFETAELAADVSTGRHVLVSTEAFVGRRAWLGDYVVIARGVSVGARVRVGHGALLESGCVVIDDVVVGDRAVIRADAVVTGDVGPGEVVGGVPAREASRRRVVEA